MGYTHLDTSLYKKQNTCTSVPIMITAIFSFFKTLTQHEVLRDERKESKQIKKCLHI